MFKLFRSFAALAAALIALAFASSALADIPKELMDKHPCFSKVRSPWDDPLATSKMPAAFQDWDTVYVGYWNVPDREPVCSVLLLTKVSDDGSRISAVYTNGDPIKREHNMWGRFSTVDGKKVLKIEKGDWWVQYVMREDGALVMSSSLSAPTGLLVPANKGDKVATIK